MRLRIHHLIVPSVALTLAIATATAQPADPQQPVVSGTLMTRWAKQVSPDNVHPEYPRPQMTREKWLNLNGTWEFQIAAEHDEPPFGKTLAGEILVPFPVESSLSGVKQRAERLWYRRTFNVDDLRLPDGRLLLHFGAVDWESTVWINGTLIGEHRGGYDAFTYDVTAALKPQGEQEIIVHVYDPTDSHTQPRGKQVNKPHGIWYTPTTGIWQTVWIEPVPQTYIESIKLTPDVDKQRLLVEVIAVGAKADVRVEVTLLGKDDEEVSVYAKPGERAVLPIKDMKLWSPDSPHLYDLRVRLLAKETSLDEIRSYFGMRKIALGKDEAGITRILLNDKPLFQIGVLDQGFWPDGLYTPPTDEALRYDLEVLKQLGFNMVRKHVKVEPARWYYWCDKLGFLVWQDMPSGDGFIGPDDPDFQRSPESTAQYELELRRLIETHYNAPCIIMWVVFNEGWGQFDTARITDWTRKLDPTRLVNSTSGWTDRGVGDVLDVHVYPGPGCPPPEPNRAAVLGEFGGLGLPLAGHTWQSEKNWGYRNLTTREELTDRYVALIDKLRFLIHDPGCSAAVYTQTTDVETEVNGLMTYDREVIKPDVERVREAHAKLHLPPPKIEEIVPTSRDTAIEWRYVMKNPLVGDTRVGIPGWAMPSYDDSSWHSGPAGFGTPGTPGAIVRTEWNTANIWLRLVFTLPADFKPGADLRFLIHHDEDVVIYINGVLAAKADGYTTAYTYLPIAPAAIAALKPGENTLAVHCRQTTGGQYIDVGIVHIK